MMTKLSSLVVYLLCLSVIATSLSAHNNTARDDFPGQSATPSYLWVSPAELHASPNRVPVSYTYSHNIRKQRIFDDDCYSNWGFSTFFNLHSVAGIKTGLCRLHDDLKGLFHPGLWADNRCTPLAPVGDLPAGDNSIIEVLAKERGQEYYQVGFNNTVGVWALLKRNTDNNRQKPDVVIPCFYQHRISGVNRSPSERPCPGFTASGKPYTKQWVLQKIGYAYRSAPERCYPLGRGSQDAGSFPSVAFLSMVSRDETSLTRPPPESSEVSDAAIAGAVIGGTVLTFIVGVAAWNLCRCIDQSCLADTGKGFARLAGAGLQLMTRLFIVMTNFFQKYLYCPECGQHQKDGCTSVQRSPYDQSP